MTLVDQEGGKQTFTVGPEAVNFDKVKTGDEVRLSYQEERVIYLRNWMRRLQMVLRWLPPVQKGLKTRRFCRRSDRSDGQSHRNRFINHAATLTFPNGESRTVPVRPDVGIA